MTKVTSSLLIERFKLSATSAILFMYLPDVLKSSSNSSLLISFPSWALDKIFSKLVDLKEDETLYVNPFSLGISFPEPGDQFVGNRL